jgi:hypothetical protein
LLAFANSLENRQWQRMGKQVQGAPMATVEQCRGLELGVLDQYLFDMRNTYILRHVVLEKNRYTYRYTHIYIYIYCLNNLVQDANTIEKKTVQLPITKVSTTTNKQSQYNYQ